MSPTPPPTGPLQRLDVLEQRVSALEEAMTRPAEEPSSESSSRAHPRPVTKEAASLLLAAFDELCFENNGSQPVQYKDVLDRAKQKDVEGHVPSATSETLRALIAERAGLDVKWSRKPIVSLIQSKDPRCIGRRGES